MTPDELAAKGLRVKPLVWERSGANNLKAGGPGLSYFIEEAAGRNHSSVIGRGSIKVLFRGVDRQRAISAAQEHHAAAIAAMIEGGNDA